jgi:hypothetical protein
VCRAARFQVGGRAVLDSDNPCQLEAAFFGCDL